MGQVRGDGYYECLLLKESISSLVIYGCNVWCRLVGCIFFWFLLGEYNYVSLNKPYYSGFKILWRGWRTLVRCGRLLWEK